MAKRKSLDEGGSRDAKDKGHKKAKHSSSKKHKKEKDRSKSKKRSRDDSRDGDGAHPRFLWGNALASLRGQHLVPAPPPSCNHSSWATLSSHLKAVRWRHLSCLVNCPRSSHLPHGALPLQLAHGAVLKWSKSSSLCLPPSSEDSKLYKLYKESAMPSHPNLPCV